MRGWSRLDRVLMTDEGRAGFTRRAIRGVDDGRPPCRAAGGAMLVLLVSLSAAVHADAPFVAGAAVEKLADGFRFTEGCASDANGNVYFTDQPTDRILMWSVDGALSTFLEPAGRSNGLCVAGDGRLWACADERNELRTIDPRTKEVAKLVTEFGGKRLNGPNDVWVSPAGGGYFTDPLYKRPYWPRGEIEREEKRGVYHVAADGRVTRVAEDLVQPNGIIGTLDGTTLFVADINAGKTYRYTIAADGSLTDKRVFCGRGSDGMTIDDAGNVYLTSGAVRVYDRTGSPVAELAVPERPSNVCFGGRDMRTLFITAQTGLYAVRCTTRGVGSQ